MLLTCRVCSYISSSITGKTNSYTVDSSYTEFIPSVRRQTCSDQIRIVINQISVHWWQISDVLCTLSHVSNIIHKDFRILLFTRPNGIIFVSTNTCQKPRNIGTRTCQGAYQVSNWLLTCHDCCHMRWRVNVFQSSLPYATLFHRFNFVRYNATVPVVPRRLPGQSNRGGLDLDHHRSCGTQWCF